MPDDEDGEPSTSLYERITGSIAVSVLVVAWAVTLLIILTLKSDGVVRVASAFAAIAGAIGTVLQLLTGAGVIFQQRKFPSISRQMTARLTAIVLLINIVSTAGWLAWHLYQVNRAIDITAQVQLRNNIGVRPGAHADFDVNINVPRSHIVILFRADDHNIKIGTCLHNTRFLVRPYTAGNPGATTNVTPGEPLSLRLADNTRHLHLDVTVTNIRNDDNCAVDIAVSSAKLTNG
jgi:hypothetical protein